MRLLVGLGNPGEEYRATRHNIGFVCLDEVAQALEETSWRDFKDGQLLEVKRGKEKVLLFKPHSFMNRSGLPIRQVVDYFNIATSDIVIVTDDVYVAPGSIRIRKSGGDGGHNGLRSIMGHLEPDDFWRVKIGVGLYEQHPQKRMQQPALDAYVLQPLPAHERKQVEKAIDKVVPNLIQWLEQGELEEQTLHS